VGLIQNAQDRLNSAQEGLNNQLKSSLGTAAAEADRLAQGKRSAERRAELLDREKRRNEAASAAEIQALQKRLTAAEQELASKANAIQARDQAIAERDTLLDQWVVSQTAFRNLFKKFGKTVDGTPIVDLPPPEKQKIIDDEIDEVKTQRAKEQHKPSR